MKSIGIDLGSSFIKGVLVDIDSGETISSYQYPDREMSMISENPGWAEQDPNIWWKGVKHIIKSITAKTSTDQIRSIGISYQMHGLVVVDKNLNPIRNSIIWCDSRAVSLGRQALNSLGRDYCLNELLNSPGNFTASKMRWVIENERKSLENAYKLMLPGDFIAAKLTGEISTTISGLSEGIMFNFHKKSLATKLLDHYEIERDMIPHYHNSFEGSLKISSAIADDLGLPKNVYVSYRAGDQPNNAFSLNVLHPGEAAATAGTSGVIYGVTDEVRCDPHSRVNTFAHVNYNEIDTRLGILLCINGTGILNKWIKNEFGWKSYEAMNDAIKSIPAGSEGILVFPFGNGSERVLEDREPGCAFQGINFNQHSKVHIARAAHEGIAFSLYYGLKIMKNLGLDLTTIRAGNANMFYSSVFRQTLSNIAGVPIELYNTNGAIGAAIGAAVGTGEVNMESAFKGLKKVNTVEPAKDNILQESYDKWESVLNKSF